MRLGKVSRLSVFNIGQSILSESEWLALRDRIL
jgi:hypothetical protein